MVTGEKNLPCARPLNEKLLKKVSVGMFALKAIQNCETDFKIHSYEKTSHLGSQLVRPRLDPQIL